MNIGKLVTGLFMLLAAVTFNAHAMLVERLNGAAFFDEDTGLTWLTDAGASGLLDWQSALKWADELIIDGTTGWRLPTADTSCATTGVACPNSEMGDLYSSHGITALNPDMFTGISFGNYWTATTSTLDGDRAYQFNFLSGLQFDESTANTAALAWAVYDGDPAVIPVPAAAWLFASGLLGLIGIARRS